VKRAFLYYFVELVALLCVFLVIGLVREETIHDVISDESIVVGVVVFTVSYIYHYKRRMKKRKE